MENKHITTKVTQFTIKVRNEAKSLIKKQGYFFYDKGFKDILDNNTRARNIAIYGLSGCSFEYWLSILSNLFNDHQKLMNPTVSSLRTLFELNTDIGILRKSTDDEMGIRFWKQMVNEYMDLNKYNAEAFTEFDTMKLMLEVNALGYANQKNHWTNINKIEERTEYCVKCTNKQSDAVKVNKIKKNYYTYYKIFSKMGTHVTPLMINVEEKVNEIFIINCALVSHYENTIALADVLGLPFYSENNVIQEYINNI